MDSRVDTAPPAPPGGAKGLHAVIVDDAVIGDAAGQINWPRRHCDLPHRIEPGSETGLPSQNPKSLRILLVDDTFSNRRLVELILRGRGHHVVSVPDGKGAIKLAQDPGWDVILMDLQMPAMNGWQVTAAIRRQELAAGRLRPVPIIALTAFTIPGNRERSLEAGMDDFLAKPIDPQMLVEAVEVYGRRESDSY